MIKSKHEAYLDKRKTFEFKCKPNNIITFYMQDVLLYLQSMFTSNNRIFILKLPLKFIRNIFGQKKIQFQVQTQHYCESFRFFMISC